ncbi:WD-repeat protein [Minicystis rosea]|nr:WD-repeat protein [Minicystis rosea]
MAKATTATAKKTPATKAKPKRPALGKVLASLGALATKPLRPAKDAELAPLKKAFGAMPADLAALYALGGNLDVVGDSGGWSLLTPKTAASHARILRDAGAPATAIPVSSDVAGNMACFDTKTGSIVDWDHETGETSNIAASLAAYLDERFVQPIAESRRDDAAIEAESRRDDAAIEAESKLPAPAPSALPAAPKTIRAVASALLEKLDKPSYAGGGQAVALLGDDRVAMGFNQSVSLFELGAKEEVSVFTCASALAFDATSNRLLAADRGVVALIDVTSNEIVARGKVAVAFVTTAAFSADGAFAATGDTSGTVLVFDARGDGIPTNATGSSDREQRHFLPEAKPMGTLAGTGMVEALRFSPDSTAIAVGSSDGSIALWSTATSAQRTTFRAEGPVRAIDFSLDGASLYVCTESGQIEVFDRGGKALRKWKPSPRATSLRTLASGQLATFGEKAFAVCDPTTGKALAKLAITAKGKHRPKIHDAVGAFVSTSGPAMIVRIA